MHIFNRKKEGNAYKMLGTVTRKYNILRSAEQPITSDDIESISLRTSRSKLFKNLGIRKGSATSNESKRNLVANLHEQQHTLNPADDVRSQIKKDRAYNAYLHDGAADSTSDSISSDSCSFKAMKEPRDFSSLRCPVDISQLVNEHTVVHRPRMRCMLSVFSDARKDEWCPTSGRSPEPNSSPITVMSSAGQESTTGSSTDSDMTAEQTFSVDWKGRVIGTTQVQKNVSPYSTELHEYNPCFNDFLNMSDSVPEATIATVEATSAAKAFFETHYNDIFYQSSSPRSIRRRKFERQLFALDLPYTKMQEAKDTWCREEGTYLRKSRVFKAKSMVRYSQKRCTVDHFEDVRVLGKGSFGVVRLVREKEDSSYGDHISHDPRQLPRRYSNGLAGNSFCGPARNRTAGKIYAMKVIRKSHMLRNCQEGHLRAERDFLVASETSKWIVPLHASFQDYSNLYLVMEFMIGGDFLTYLLREDVLDEAAARWYIAEMILCIEEIHKMRWIHRDVKPDNFLISPSGHLKISDFGLAFDGHWSHTQAYYHNHRYLLAEQLGIRIFGDSQDSFDDDDVGSSFPAAIGGKQSQNQSFPNAKNMPEQIKDETLIEWRNRTQNRKLAKSIVGTSQYMAPEVVRGEPYDGRCDWWSVGIILYESLYGRPPFFGEDRAMTKEIIKHHALYLRFPNESRIARPTCADRSVLAPVSREAVDLMSRLLRSKELRLCSPKYADNDKAIGPNKYPSRLTRQANQRHVGPRALNFAYADDAEDIKAHPFFHGIRWHSLDRETPPFVPHVQHDLAEYFEPEKDLLTDMSNDESDSDYEETAWYPNDVGLDKAGTASPFARWVAMKTWDLDGANGEMQLRNMQLNVKKQQQQQQQQQQLKKKKQQKRPRDKILRDPLLCKTVMDVRKKGAFLGYTYRRPRALELNSISGVHLPTVRRGIPTFS